LALAGNEAVAVKLPAAPSPGTAIQSPERFGT